MKKFDQILDTVMRFIMALAMFALLAGGTWQITTRWILGNPSTFTDEFLRYVLIWASMLGSAYCFYKDEHLALDLVKDRVKGGVRVALLVFIEAAILFFVCYVFVFGGMKLVLNATNQSSVMRIPFKLLYACLPISGIFIVIARIIKYIQLYIDSKGGK
ncbi:TRAP transporter small permease [Lacrimispora sp. 210928-DFI.3.58]|uniref:TRAP transporter small permease n=1 Tax=Lacrimispora sp. 210928-DFI.3.58 TaxID=2883214 RepID=UPI0015B580B4|nr:TRAP transporter small permease [Lacrimispora sp. 210928-DFI.3.58]MCB7320558.1 TRAP transporter small permease [Lacrimispora sp. 210928-DFI.3.58]